MCSNSPLGLEKKLLGCREFFCFSASGDAFFLLYSPFYGVCTVVLSNPPSFKQYAGQTLPAIVSPPSSSSSANKMACMLYSEAISCCDFWSCCHGDLGLFECRDVHSRHAILTLSAGLEFSFFFHRSKNIKKKKKLDDGSYII